MIDEFFHSKDMDIPLRLMKVVCPDCSGNGFTVEPICCENLSLEYGCCNTPEPAQKECERCNGSKIIYLKSL